MTSFNIKCKLSEVTKYLEKNNVFLSEDEHKQLTSIFNDCDEYNDKADTEGQDGALNDTEWSNFIRILALKIPIICNTVFNFKLEKEFNHSVLEQLKTQTDDNTTIKKNSLLIGRYIEPPTPEDENLSFSFTPDLAKNVENYKDGYDSFILKYAEEYDLDPNLVKAIIRKESGFNPKTYSEPSKCMGLMQVSSIYVKGNLYDPEKNIKEGCRMLKESIDAFDGDVKKGLMGYQRGISGAKNAINRKENPVNPDNDSYVKKVLNFYNELKQHVD